MAVAAAGMWLGMPQAMAVPASDADAVISDLQAQGYRVIVSTIGSGRSGQCTVKSVVRQSPMLDVPANKDMHNKLVVTVQVARVTLLC